MVGDNFTAQEPTFRSSSTHGYNFTLITCTLCQDASCSILIYSAASRSCSRVWIAPCKDGPPDVCDQTLFFDSVHPNARVHKIIGERIADRLLPRTSAASLISDAREVTNPEPSTMRAWCAARFQTDKPPKI